MFYFSVCRLFKETSSKELRSLKFTVYFLPSPLFLLLRVSLPTHVVILFVYSTIQPKSNTVGSFLLISQPPQFGGRHCCWWRSHRRTPKSLAEFTYLRWCYFLSGRAIFEIRKGIIFSSSVIKGLIKHNSSQTSGQTLHPQRHFVDNLVM